MSGTPQSFKMKARDVIINGWSDKDEELRKFLEENKAAIDKFKDATRLRECNFEEELNPEIKKEPKQLNYYLDLLKTALKAYSEGDELSEAIAKHVEESLMARAVIGHSESITKFYTKVAELDLLINAVAIRLYELENRISVNDLYELVPKYISSLPRDPFNYFLHFRYVHKDNGWVLYSLGPDKKDDNAELIYDEFIDNTKKEGDIVISSF